MDHARPIRVPGLQGPEIPLVTTSPALLKKVSQEIQEQWGSQLLQAVSTHVNLEGPLDDSLAQKALEDETVPAVMRKTLLSILRQCIWTN